MAPMSIDDASPQLQAWLTEIGLRGPFHFRELAGGNSNETMLLESGDVDLVVRRPPRAKIAGTAHDVGREGKILSALQGSSVPVPRLVASCEDPAVPEAPLLLMAAVEGVSLRDRIPAGSGSPVAAIRAIAEQATDALADLHSLDWRAVGLDGFGRPDGFLERQVPRWRKQLRGYSHRDLVDLEPVAEWLEANRPDQGEAGILHGDYHVDNCLFEVADPPRLAAVIDWEMSTIGDPLLDLGLFLAFWGRDRAERPAMPAVQAISRIDGAPTRSELAERYAARSGRSIEHLPYYMALAFWKLAVIVEGAHAHWVAGDYRSAYAAALEEDVPALLREARWFTRL
jgi:aminoglycoside phosphotransferase (APT) family kinase protein